ncbi:MAG: DUF4097 domain-containing protein [Defluviitaleaceae bacterium]|nr:DUF4097 domain-containing protein [Defluviitaleaceae bacterium]
MANEKLSILKMLEDGKITSAEAVKLLDSIDNNAAAPKSTENKNNSGSGSSTYTSAAPGIPSASRVPETPRASHTEYSGYSNNGRPSSSSGTSSSAPRPASSGRSFDEFAGDLQKKFNAFAKEMEPKIQRFTETVAEKTVNIADKISKGLSQDPSEARRPSPEPRRASASPPGGMEKSFELPVSAGYNELNLISLNGDFRVKGYNGDKITMRVTYKPRRSNAEIDLKKLGGKYFLNYEEDDFEKVSIDAYVPERLFQVINFSGINGNMDISSLAAEEMRLTNAHGQTRLAGLAANRLKVESSNGKLTLNAIAADSADIENYSGTVEAEELDIANMSLTNLNGGISLIMSAFARYDDYLWSVETSNAKLSFNLPTLPDLAYHVKAHATLGEIRLALTGMQFLTNDSSLIEARSTNFDRAAKKVKLAAETSNGPLLIN